MKPILLLVSAIATIITIFGIITAPRCAHTVNHTQSNQITSTTHLNPTTKPLVKTDFKIGDQFAVMATQSHVNWNSLDCNWYIGGGKNNPLTPTYTQTKYYPKLFH